VSAIRGTYRTRGTLKIRGRRGTDKNFSSGMHLKGFAKHEQEEKAWGHSTGKMHLRTKNRLLVSKHGTKSLIFSYSRWVWGPFGPRGRPGRTQEEGSSAKKKTSIGHQKPTSNDIEMGVNPSLSRQGRG